MLNLHFIGPGELVHLLEKLVINEGDKAGMHKVLELTQTD